MHGLGCPPVWGRLPQAPALSPSANSKQSLQFLKTQLETCSQEHGDCSHDCPLLPTRVLDVGSADVQHVKLFEPPAGTPGKYIAISYCWGEGNGLKVIGSNKSDLVQGIDEDELPATIRDAIELARYLRVQYLWVDALCIIQDDTQDWLHESSHMADVYAQAFLTISASSVDSSRMSFLHQSRGNKEVLFQVKDHTINDQHNQGIDENSLDTQYCTLAVRRTAVSGFHQDAFDEIIDPSMGRAWTLQEHMLSTRLVSFSTDEVQWTCRTLRACECGSPEDHGAPRLERLRQDLKEAGKTSNQDQLENVGTTNLDWKLICHDFWCIVVETYCRRNLSWMRDKLPALSGVAREFFEIMDESRPRTTTDMLPLRYLAGLWEHELHRGLLWKKGVGEQDVDPVEYRAPSWSWASIESDVFTFKLVRPDLSRKLVPQIEVLEVACALANPADPFGQVLQEGTYLRVRGTVTETQMKLRRKGRGWAVQYDTAHGFIFLDTPVEDVPLNKGAWGEDSGVESVTDNAEESDPRPSRTVRRRRGKRESDVIADRLKERASRRSESGPDHRSDDELDDAVPYDWEEANLGKTFTVWLLLVAESHAFDSPSMETLVLGRPAGDEEVYERIGYLAHRHEDNLKWTEQASGQPKSTITIV